MDERFPLPGAPAAHDVVEVIDRLSATSVSAIVESADDRRFVLRFEQATRVPDEARVRWFDGATAWQAIAHCEHIAPNRVTCEVVSPHTWEPTPVRHSPRAPVDNSQLLVRIVSSSVLARGRRLHALCLDFSETGCRANWPGRTPRLGDAVDLAWEADGSLEMREGDWVSARVVRIISRPFGARHVCFGFEASGALQAERIRTWHQAWLERHRQRLRDDRAA